LSFRTARSTGAIVVTVGGDTLTGPEFETGAAPAQDFGVVSGPAQLTLVQGGQAAYQIQLSDTGTEPFTGLVRLSVSGLPAGVTATFRPAFVSAVQIATMQLVAADNATTANANLMVSGDNESAPGTAAKTSNVSLSVVAAAGQTGVAGRFVDPDGKGIAGVRVRHDTTQTITDVAGNFLLSACRQAR